MRQNLLVTVLLVATRVAGEVLADTSLLLRARPTPEPAHYRRGGTEVVVTIEYAWRALSVTPFARPEHTEHLCVGVLLVPAVLGGSIRFSVIVRSIV
jgi:hypothetical protein